MENTIHTHKQGEFKYHYFTEKGNVIGTSQEHRSLKLATHEDYEKQQAERADTLEKSQNTPEQVANRKAKLFGKVVTELSTGAAAIKTARAGISYPNIRKAALSVCESAKFESSVSELVSWALTELKID